jgi:chromate transport protein ChrA
MDLYFLIPLCSGLITGYIFKKCADEIGYLTGIFAAIFLVFSLIFAPWQILLLLLVGMLLVTKKLLEENKYKIIQDEIQQIKRMKREQSATSN